MRRCLFTLQISLPQDGIEMTVMAGAVIPSKAAILRKQKHSNEESATPNFQYSMFNAQVPSTYLCISVR